MTDSAITAPAATSRKSLRIAVGVLFFLAGLCFSSWASRIPAIQARMGLNDAAWGAVLFSLPVGLMCSLPFSGWIIPKIGSKKVLVAAILVYGICLMCLGLAQNTIQLIICLILFGFSSNAVNISVNTQAVANEKMYDKPIMASFHGLWSLAGFTGGGIGWIMIAHHVDPFRNFIFTFVIVVIGVLMAIRNLYDDTHEPKAEPATKLTLSDRLKLIVPLLTLGSIAFCSMICEGAMFDWSALYFKKVVEAPIEKQGVGFTAFMLTMAGGRFVADWFVQRFGLKRTLQVSGSLTVTGLLIAITFPYFYTSIAGFLLVGAGVSSVVPMVYSVAGRSKTLSPGVALAAVSTIGFVGFLVGPPIIGFIAGIATLRASFAFIAFMGTCVVVLSTRAKLDN